MIFCPHCQEPVPDGALACRNCHTPINQSEIVAANIIAAKKDEFVVGGINWGAVLLGALIALAIWNGGMFGLVRIFGEDGMWFSLIVKITAVASGAYFAGYRSYSAELTHGLLVAALIGIVNGAFAVFFIGVESTIMAMLLEFIFIDMLPALAGAFLGAKMQR